MSAASANGPNVKSENRVVTAMSIIFKNRLPTMNALQRNLGIILYNNHLQKDAFHILSKIGITTSYSTMNKDLHRIKNFADQAVQRMKKSLEENGCQNTAEQNDHSYTKLENNTPTSMNDHSYSKNTPECADKPHDNLSPAYRFNLDNLDFHLKVRDMTQDHQNMLKHYVQLMAVKDRVPLGILPLNENKTSEMIDVLKYLHKFVPGHREEEEIMNEEIRDDTSAGMRTIPCGGDQLSVERLRSAHSARFDGDTPEERLEGVIAMVEDFHEKMNFLQVIMDKFYATSSAQEQGTLYQLRNVINRRNVVKTVSQDYHADSSFIDLVTDCHVITAAMEHFNLEEVNSTSDRIPADIETADVPTKKGFLHLAAEVVDKYFLNSLNESIVRIEDRDDKDRQNDDKILNYATNLTKLGLLRKLSVMATRYGDGLRAMRHWKYAFLVYHQSKKTKYRLESFLLLAGINALFTPRQRHQIVFNRFVNLKGGGRYAKSRVKLLGPNQSSEVINRIGKTMMTCHNIQEKLENSLNVSLSSGFHKKQDLERDRASIIKHLKEGKVFSNILGRCHHSFQKEKSDLFGDINIREFHAYIHDKKKVYSNKKLAF
ncbi:unnamed protein product [Mytilus coruscus]|uniref:DUF6589 domain-containing protein n=1 Tax=Mytilus coruscus TaxID=42192 RepID=A0A6J8C8T7_MYTCO|nr:unnamed protein product [Mytilus coruscus]